jgi:hypothetical protein
MYTKEQFLIKLAGIANQIASFCKLLSATQSCGLDQLPLSQLSAQRYPRSPDCSVDHTIGLALVEALGFGSRFVLGSLTSYALFIIEIHKHTQYESDSGEKIRKTGQPKVQILQ